MKFHLALIIALLLVISGCAKTGPSCASPSIPLQNGCCLDINRNGVCDRAESDVVAEETAEAQFNPVEETPAESAESKAPAKPSSPLAPTSTATARPIIGTRGEETLDTSGWESIRLYYRDTIERCGKKIDFVSADSSVAAGDSITLQIGIPRETINQRETGFVIESAELDYVIEDMHVFSGADEGMSYVSLKLHCK